MWGAAMVFYDLFPARLLKPAFKQITTFAQGHPADKRPFMQRLQGELTPDPLAFAMPPSPFPMRLPLKPVDVSSYRGPAIAFLDRAKYYSDTTREEYFLIYGSFAFEDADWGVILISTEGRVLRGWSMNPRPREYRDKHRGHIGLALSPTGDLATNTHGVLTSRSWCGERNWEAASERRPGPYERAVHHGSGFNHFHHDITYHEGRFYTFLGSEIVSVDARTGEIMERIHKAELFRWARAQDSAIFNSPCNTSIAYYFNKVDVLSPELADSFDNFEAGDLLISMITPSLVFVVRPGTSEILWYRFGLTSDQHDATFQRGYISVFDNNPITNSGPSPRIVTLGVNTHTRSILFDLKTWGVKMPYRGNFELDEGRNLLAFSDDDNGRAILGELSGKPWFIFENQVGTGKSLPLRNMTRVSPQQIEKWSAQCN